MFYINLFFGTNVFQDNFTHQAMLQLSSCSNKLTLGHAFKLKLFSQNTLFKLPSICYYYRRTCEWTLVYELKWKYQSKPHNISSMRSYTTSYADIGDWKKKKTSSKLNFYTPQELIIARKSLTKHVNLKVLRSIRMYYCVKLNVSIGYWNLFSNMKHLINII